MVVADMGARSASTTCGGINDGAVHVYVRSSATSPWPTQPTQTFLSGARESHFGETIYLRGNTLLISESRASQGATQQVGAFHYYRRTTATSPFQWVDTEYKPANAQGPMFTLNGFASNGKYAVGITQGSEPNIRVFKLTATSIQPIYAISNPRDPLYVYDEIAITDDDVLVVVKNNSRFVDLFKLTDTGHSAIDASSLTLADNSQYSQRYYRGEVAVRGRDIAVLAQAKSTAAPPNDLVTYYAKAFTVNGTAVQVYGNAAVPQALNEAAGYGIGRDTLELAPGPTVLVNIAGTGGVSPKTARALAYEFDTTTGFRLAAEIDVGQLDPKAGKGQHQDFGQPLIYEGGKLYIGDPFDTTAQQPCRIYSGAVRVFDLPLDTNPKQVCIGAQDVPFSFAPVAGATSYSWWANGEAQVSYTQNNAIVDFGGSFSSGTINMGAQRSSAPYYVTRSVNVTAVPCDTSGGSVSGDWYQCSGAQGRLYTTTPVANATAYNWWSPGASRVVSNGPSATVDFRPGFDETTVNVGINLSVAPYYITRSIIVRQMACGERYPLY